LALEACAANARANGLSIQIASPHALPAGRYDLILANILAQPLIALAPLFAASTRAGARLALAGIRAEQAAEVIAGYAADFDLCVELVADGWALVAGQRR
jgi:ribosomal protein L11 methyltransferase